MHTLSATRPLAAAVLAGAIAAAAVLVAGCAGTAPAAVPHAPAPTGSLVPAPTGSPVPAPAVPRLAAIADRAARTNGDPAPSQVTAVLTTRAKALTSATPGDFVPGSAGVPVFLVTLRGHFTADDVSRPPGSAAPTGRYLSLVVDAATFQVTDFGISPEPPPVSPASLGPVTYLDP
jgi:hypothetical protein